MDGVVVGVVIKGVHGEVAAFCVFAESAINIVRQDHATVREVLFRLHLTVWCPEGGYLNNVPAKTYMHNLEATTDKARVSKQFVNLFRMSIGGYVKVFWMAAEEQVTHATTHQIGLVTSVGETLDNL